MIEYSYKMKLDESIYGGLVTQFVICHVKWWVESLGNVWKIYLLIQIWTFSFFFTKAWHFFIKSFFIN